MAKDKPTFNCGELAVIKIQAGLHGYQLLNPSNSTGLETGAGGENHEE